MIIYCDYCGAQIDTDKYSTCPSCGSSYANDDELKAYKERQNKLDDLDVRKKELEIDRMELENDALRNFKEDPTAQQKDVVKRQLGVGCLIPMAVFAILGIFFVLMLICIQLDPEYSSDKAKETEQSKKIINVSYSMSKLPEISVPEVPDINIGTETTYAPSAVQKGNSVICDGFTITCESVTATEPKNHRTADGNVCVLFRLVFENTGEKKQYPQSSVTCLRDGFVCSRVYGIEQKSFSYDAVPAGAKAEGYFCFEIPSDCKAVTLVYDNSIELKLNIPDNIAKS